MSKKYFLLLAISMVISIGAAFADTSIQQIQSPIYTDDIGRSHFLGRGGYSAVRTTQMNQVQTDFVNDAVNDFSNRKPDKAVENDKSSAETNITDVIKERKDVPVSSKTKATFSSVESKMDPSASFGKGATYIPSSGVNESKTIYTDDLGRLHFFGKGNIIKE